MSARTIASADGTVIGWQTLGSGPGVIVVGGALRTAEDYRPFAEALAETCTVHLLERRGRGASGPQGPGYGLDKEVDDLLAVRAATGARLAFGHSYGGLVILETQRRSPVFDRIAVFEPGLSPTPVATQWMEPYRQRLAAGDEHGAFAHFIRGVDGAPAAMRRMPYWYLHLALRVGFRGAKWQRMRPLLAASLAEHEQVAARAGRAAEFAGIAAPVLVLRGGRTPRALRDGFAALPFGTVETMPGLDHFGPEGRTAPGLARRVSAFLLG